MDVDDFADLVGLDVVGEDEGVETVLGLMAKRLGRVPIPGATIEIDGWVLVAEQGAGRRNRIGSVLASPRAGDVDDTAGADEAGGADVVAASDKEGG
jgi:CBS domain containing-hemolysin-like protein